MVFGGDRRVRGGDGGPKQRGERPARVDDLRTQRHKLVVPNFEGRERFGADAAGPRRFPQRRALSKHSLVIGDDPGHAGAPLHKQSVDESAARARVAPHNAQVFRCEQHGLQVARELAGLGDGAINLRAVRALAVELYLCRHPTSAE